MIKNLFSSTELAAAILINKADTSDLTRFKREPSAFLLAVFDVDFDDIDILPVENTDCEIHLCLPYYSQIEDFTTAVMTDEHLKEVSGGELGGLAILAIGATIAGVIGAGLSFGGAVAVASAGGYYGGQAILTRRSLEQAHATVEGREYDMNTRGK